MSEKNRALVEHFVEEAFNRGNLEAAEEIYASTFISHDPTAPEEQGTPGDVKQFVNTYRTAFPDGHTTVEDSVAEGDKVAYRWTFRGTHQGGLMGIPPTGKRVEITGITINRLSGGKIEEQWNTFDQLGMLQQIGVIPARGQ